MAVDIERWYHQHGPMVLRRCRALLGDEECARDAMHEVFVQLLRREGHLHDAGPSSLLYRMATNHCLNLIRSRRRRPEDGDDLLTTLACLDDPEAATGVRAALERLFQGEQPSTRLIAVLHWVDGLTLEETAAEVGLSVSGVRKRLRTLQGRVPERLEVPA